MRTKIDINIKLNQILKNKIIKKFKIKYIAIKRSKKNEDQS